MVLIVEITDKILEDLRSLFDNWNKPQLKEQFNEHVKKVLENNFKYASFFIRDDYIGCRYDITSESIFNKIANLLPRYEIKINFKVDDLSELLLKPRKNDILLVSTIKTIIEQLRKDKTRCFGNESCEEYYNGQIDAYSNIFELLKHNIF